MNHEINFLIDLDSENFPEKISWKAEGSGQITYKEAKALLIALWDREENVTLAIDLWTKDMLVNEMNALYYQAFIHLSESYKRATSDEDASKFLRESAEKFADLVHLKEEPTPTTEP